MESIINILPESVANQIAAGEVVNRPASAVKELLENAVDAGSTQIELHIQDAGRTLIQVIDNGCGMGQEDAERCFLPHATSKLQTANDLNHILTMGFRGEALASIAAVSQVELQTRQEDDELGIKICNEGNRITTKEACSCAKGCCFKVKNIYFNTPARRQFLKSDEVEFRYIEDEFNRIALSHPEICLLFYKNGQKIFHLEAGNLKKRIIQLMGKAYENRLLKIAESVPGLKLTGYICTPDYSVKGRGKQFLFVNRRFIKHPGLSNAVEKAYSGLLPEGKSPVFFLHLEMDPSTIDVNIHPTKTEIRFRDEKLIYGVLLSAVKHSIGVNQVRDAIDFESSELLPFHAQGNLRIPEVPSIGIDSQYNPFTHSPSRNTPSQVAGNSSPKFRYSDTQEYREAYARNFAAMQKEMEQTPATPSQLMIDCFNEVKQDTTITPADGEYELVENGQTACENLADIKAFPSGNSIPNGNGIPNGYGIPNGENAVAKTFQIFDRYIVCPLRSGLALIDQEAASERIIYNDFCERKEKNMPSQTTLFPQTMEFSSSHSELLQEIREELNQLGWGIEWIGGHSFMLNALPPDTQESRAQETIEHILDSYAYQLLHSRSSKDENVALATASQLAIKAGTRLSLEEILYLTNRLFSGVSPQVSPSGKTILKILSATEIENLFR